MEERVTQLTGELEALRFGHAQWDEEVKALKVKNAHLQERLDQISLHDPHDISSLRESNAQLNEKLSELRERLQERPALPSDISQNPQLSELQKQVFKLQQQLGVGKVYVLQNNIVIYKFFSI